MSDHDKFDVVRRTLIGGSVAGLGALALPASAAAAVQAGAAAAGVRDPKAKHPRPPFRPQTQAFPGLTSRMSPRPDHGEASYRGSGRLAARKALITGGDSGIGRAVAIAFAREGADVAINYLPVEESDARETVELIRGAGRRAVAIPGDLRQEAFCKRLVAQAAEGLGGLDILVLNASRQQVALDLQSLDTDEFDAAMKTNLYSMFWLTKAATPVMKSGSSIIVTASVVAYTPNPILYAYSMTKAAQVNFVRSMAQMLAPQGIRVNAVAPGPIWTPIQISGGATVEEYTNLGGDRPLKRPGQPAEMAPIYVGFAEEGNSYATGQVYAASGGNGET